MCVCVYFIRELFKLHLSAAFLQNNIYFSLLEVKLTSLKYWFMFSLLWNEKRGKRHPSPQQLRYYKRITDKHEFVLIELLHYVRERDKYTFNPNRLRPIQSAFELIHGITSPRAGQSNWSEENVKMRNV